MQPYKYRKGQCEGLIMKYSFLELLTGSKSIARGELTPRCDICRTRTQIQGAPQLFLLPIYQDKDYTPSAEYYSRNCLHISQVRDIPVGQRACRMWQLECPKCRRQAVLVVDFLLVRGQEVPEKLEVCDHRPLDSLLNGTNAETAHKATTAQSFEYDDIIGPGRHNIGPGQR